MGRPVSIIVFYLLAFGWSWGLWWPAVLFADGTWDVPAWLPPILASGQMAAWGPLIAAVIASAVFGGIPAVRNLFGRMIKARVGAMWWAVAILLLPVIIGLAWLIAGAMGADIPPSEAFAQPISIPFAFIWIFVLGGPLQEEAGWRGVATEGLQRLVSPAVVALIVGMMWGLWHLPLFQLPSAGIYYDQPFWGLFFSTVLLSVIIGWLYNKTGGSLLLAMVLHTSFNWANFLFPVLETELGGQLYFVGLIIACAFIFWKEGAKLGANTA